MDELLDALEIQSLKSRYIARFGIPFVFAGSMLATAYVQGIFEAKLLPSRWLCVVWVAWVWLLWTGWHSVLLPRKRRRLILDRRNPYGVAFITHIYPGITIGFSQMLRSLFNGDVIPKYELLFLMPPSGLYEWVPFFLGNTVCVGAGILFVWAWQTIGAGNAGFVPEFVRTQSFVPLRVGPYAYIRHPLFWSGIYFSLGLAFLANTSICYSIAGVNLVYGLIYNVLEDRRLIGVFGDSYSVYAKAVPRYIPAWLR